MSKLWQLTAETDLEPLAIQAEVVLESEALSVGRFRTDQDSERWRVEALFDAKPDVADWSRRLDLDCTAERLRDADWVTEAQKHLPPVLAGRFHVHGSHVPRHPSPSMHDILIEAGPAFGTGQHESTRGCLLALDRLARQHKVRRALDVGCGTGVLAIAVAMAWAKPVVATDIDPVSTRFTENAARENGVGRFITTGAGPGLQPAVARDDAPYDLICANILARPLCRLAPAIAAALAPGGRVVLSGLLWWQAPAVLAAYRAQGLPLKFRISLGGWRTLVVGH
jgi:ribosomal protein L11 methyltransferase